MNDLTMGGEHCRVWKPTKEVTMNGASLRLKMSVESVKSVADGEGNKISEEIALRAVYGKEGSANAQWSKWTPSGQLNMTINNPGAFGKLLTGNFVFVDLTVTDKDAG